MSRCYSLTVVVLWLSSSEHFLEFFIHLHLTATTTTQWPVIKRCFLFYFILWNSRAKQNVQKIYKIDDMNANITLTLLRMLIWSLNIYVNAFSHSFVILRVILPRWNRRDLSYMRIHIEIFGLNDWALNNWLDFMTRF